MTIGNGNDIENKIDIVTSYHNIPGVDSAANSQMRDVIGGKLDTVAGDSLVSISKLIESYTKKIDSLAVAGLLGVNDSLAYKTHEIERHLHSWDRWAGLAAVPAGETHRMDLRGPGIAPFQIDAGNDDFGPWVQIVGSSDTPIIPGSVYFDMAELMIDDAERNAAYFIQIGCGDSGAAALSNGTYTDVAHKPLNAALSESSSMVRMKRCLVSDKVWARCICIGQNTATIDFYIGIHEYEG